MIEKKYEKMTIFELVSQIEDKADAIINKPEIDTEIVANEIAIAAGSIEVRFRILRTILYMSIALLVTIGMVAISLFSDNRKIKSLNDRLIENSQPTEFDSLKDRILLDSIGEIRYQTDETGAPISYRSLLRENTKLKDSLKVSEQLLDMAKRNYGIYFKQSTVGKKTYITIGSKKLEELDENTVESLKKMYPLLDSINKK